MDATYVLEAELATVLVVQTIRLKSDLTHGKFVTSPEIPLSVDLFATFTVQSLVFMCFRN